MCHKIYSASMEKTDRRIIRTREKVLQSAECLFVQKGISSVTHLAVSEHSGVGRKTIYRHWPTVNALLSDTLANASFPPSPDTGNLSEDLMEHLEALRQALEVGPLGYILHALNERAHTDPDMKEIRDRLTRNGCKGIIDLLKRSVKRGELTPPENYTEAAARLEGPIFYYALVRNQAVPNGLISASVAHFVKQHT